MAQPLDAPLTSTEIADARRRIGGVALRTPLLAARQVGVWLKPEGLQPFGSYKIRGATNAVEARRERGEDLSRIVTASAGNFGQSIAASAARLGVPCVVHVPDNAAEVKVGALRTLGAKVRRHSFADWWTIMMTRETGEGGAFFHPVADREVMAGAATIGAELLEDLPAVETVFIPIGGGGLACGIAQAVKAVRPQCRIVAVESEAARPLDAAFQAGEPVTVTREPSFIDGMGSTRVLDEMWPLLRWLVDEVAVVPVAEIEAALRTLAREHHIIAEGAGAAALAAASRRENQASVAIVSGGNIDPAVLAGVLTG